MTTRRQFNRIALAAALPAAWPLRATADAPALRSLQLVVPSPAGTQPDLIARWLAEPIAQAAGVPGTVLNRPGAAGAIAVDAVMASAPEAGMLLIAGLDHVAYSHLGNQRRALDPLSDLQPVGAVNRDTWLVATGRDAPFATLAALAEASKRAPLLYASGGEGTTAHLLAARLCRALGIEATHVAYRESYVPDLVAGRVHFALAPTPSMLGHLGGGRVRALASLSDERLPVAPDAPSIRELGHPDQAFQGGLFLFAPNALAGQVARMNGWLRDAMARPEIAARYRDSGIAPAPLDVEQTRASIRERLQRVDAMRIAVFGRAR